MPGFPTTKLRPPRAPATAIARPRLEALLDAARETLRATLLVAPAGYGKTTLVSTWLRRRRGAVAWFALDPGDDDGHDPDPERLVAGWLGAALASAGAWDGGAALTTGHRGEAPPDGGAVRAAPAEPRALAAALEASGWRGVVVLDDAHHLSEGAAAGLANWVERAPDGVHTLVLARQSPPLPIARWLARGEAELLGPDALRLDPVEGRALVAALLPQLEQAHADMLVTRVEGWPAGVQLAARSLRGKADPVDLIERFTGTDRYVLAFLTEEVLLRLPDDLHEAALLLAGEARLCSGLVSALTGRPDGAAVLARLEAHETFLERLDSSDDEGPWFRFPDFFRDLLSHRLALSHPDLPPQLAARAATWWHHRTQRPSAATATTPGTAPGAAAATPIADELTERERQVLTLLAAGASTKTIARRLGLSPNTIKTHTRHVFEKLGVRNRTEAAARARELHLL